MSNSPELNVAHKAATKLSVSHEIGDLAAVQFDGEHLCHLSLLDVRVLLAQLRTAEEWMVYYTRLFQDKEIARAVVDAAADAAKSSAIPGRLR